MELNKYQLKNLHKVNGIIFAFTDINTNILGITIYKGGNNKRYMYFLAFNEIKDQIKKEFNLKDRIKIRFYIKADQYNNKWYNNLIILSCERWKKKSEEIKELQNKEVQSHTPITPNTEFLEQPDPNQIKLNL